jgi:hypothetical protein
MSTSDEYRLFAEESLRWARAAKTEAERRAFLDMARTWTKAAAKLTHGEAIPGIPIPTPGEAGPETLQ